MSALVLLSGGMDSSTAAYWAKEKFGSIDTISIDYGQRHWRELDSAEFIAGALDADHCSVDISDIAEHFPGSALTDRTVAVPEGHYADETMKATVVPNRNAIMLNIAVGVAVAQGHEAVIAGMHAGDHPIYPDCRPAFIATMNQLARIANEGFCLPNFQIEAPWLMNDKSYIVSEGERLGVPWAETWSCYVGGDVHCGKCGTCVERREAFSIAGVVDPTPYA